MNEETFLRNRQIREEQKLALKDGESEGAIARDTFLSELEDHHKRIEFLLSAQEESPEVPPLQRCSEAHKVWMEMQESIRCGADVLRLPPHGIDQQVWP